MSEDVVVDRISTLLEAAGTVDGQPIRLAENQGIAFIGCYVLGMGFVLGPDEAQQWIADDRRNAEVLFPYLSGEDLNSRADSSPSRWVIDFKRLTAGEAARYKRPFERVHALVLPERAKVSIKRRREVWWQFASSAPALRSAMVGLDHVLVLTIHSRVALPILVPTSQVFSHALVVFATSSVAEQAVLSSSIHQFWAIKYGSGIRSDPRYTPSDVFETFPRPEGSSSLEDAGKTLDAERRGIMLRHGLGLTKLYNLINDPDITDTADPDVARMRQIHVDLDNAVMTAYGWDVPLDHGFHTYRQMRRWTVSPAARVEILDRLLAENHRRAALQGEAPPAPDDAEDKELDE